MRELEIKYIFLTITSFYVFLLLECRTYLCHFSIIHSVSEEWSATALGGYPDEIKYELDDTSDDEEEEYNIHHRFVLFLLGMFEHILDNHCH